MIGIVQRFAAIGALPDDTEDERIRKGALTLASGIVSALAPIWIITYLILDLPVSAAIPFTYVVISVASLNASGPGPNDSERTGMRSRNACLREWRSVSHGK